MQKHKKRKTCKNSNKIKKNTFAPAISTSYLLPYVSFWKFIFCDRRFNCIRAILKVVLESGQLIDKTILQFYSIFEMDVKMLCSTI